MTKRILHVVTNVAHYADPTQPTGPSARGRLWRACRSERKDGCG